ncbi:hypothetical protein ACFFTN_01160 [Aminobacter aganoensis]|uniref:Uncharacterized protein n=1 Tax=Aminobacter aganoensis TaxID=83264 RepID=A0A7X0KJZ7_9HYPH|nr:hypothetical protein [Aminobacter aganoensis]MBB6353535.1 hypothetical protein [Aminobacter aganoensis]
MSEINDGPISEIDVTGWGVWMGHAIPISVARHIAGKINDLIAGVHSPALSDEQIAHMVSRFLGWRLPDDFSPDGGISFKRDYNTATPWPSKHEPVGTNLFDVNQAEAMVRHMLEGMPAATRSSSMRSAG